MAESPRFGTYELLETLGEGGMGRVYLARHPQLPGPIALKTLLPGSLDARTRARFNLEAWAVARLRHPHIIRVYDLGELDGVPFIAMEAVTQGTLKDEIEAGLEPARALTLTAQLARALDHAHARGIVHRDVKPANVLINSAGEAVLTDFGIARVEALGLTEAERSSSADATVTGTLHYMAPEQLDASLGSVDGRSDLYALGATLYHALVGAPPFEGSQLELIGRLLHAPPPSGSLTACGLPGELETIIARCLAKRPEQRYASGEALADDLERAARGEPIAALPLGRWERAATWLQRRARAAAAVLAIIILTAAASALALTIAAETWEQGEALAAAAASEARAAAELAQQAVARAERETRELEAERARVEAARDHLAALAERARAGEAAARAHFEQARDLARAFIFEFNGAIAEVPGATRARALLVTHGMRYLHAQGAESPAEQAELALAWQAIARLQWSQSASLGQLGAARESLARALRLAEGLSAADGGPRLAAELELNLAKTHLDVGEREPARRLCIAALRRVEGDEAREAELLRVNILNVEAIACSGLGRFDEAEALLERALAVLEGIPDASDHLRVALLSALAGVAQRRGDVAGAITHYERARAVLAGQLQSAPGNLTVLFRLATMANNLGALLGEAGRTDEALAAFEDAVAGYEALAEADAANLAVRGHLLRCATNAGLTCARAGRCARALAHYERASAHLERLGAESAARLQDRTFLIEKVLDLAEAPEAGSAAPAALALARRLLAWLPEDAAPGLRERAEGARDGG